MDEKQKRLALKYVVVHAKRGDRSLGQLSDTTEAVHVRGHLFKWLAIFIGDTCPNLKVLRVNPDLRALAHEYAPLIGKEVEIKTGHMNPRLVRKPGRHGHPKEFYEKLEFLKNLRGETRGRWLALLRFKEPAALMTALFYGRSHDRCWNLGQISAAFGRSDKTRHYISAQIGAVFAYLDAPFPISKASRTVVKMLRQRMEARQSAIRAGQRRNDQRRKLCNRLKLKALPEGLKPSMFASFALVVRASRDGRMGALRLRNAKAAQVLLLRYGRDPESPVCLSHRKIQRRLHAGSYQLMQQTEQSGLKLLREWQV